MGKPFHELTRDEYSELCKQKLTYGQLAELHPQPEWCEYPEATAGMMGCWSLMGFHVTGRDYCKNCDCSKDYKKEGAGSL